MDIAFTLTPALSPPGRGGRSVVPAGRAAAGEEALLHSTRRTSPNMPCGATTTNVTSNSPTTSTLSSEDTVTVTICCSDPSRTAPITGPTQLTVPPMIGMANADTA